MTGAPDLAGAPMARAVLARGSWRPAAMRGAERLLGGLAAQRAPLLERARRLQAWHDGLAQRWRPLDAVQPASPVVGAGPVSAAGLAVPSASLHGAAAVRSAAPGTVASRRAVPARIAPAPGDGSRGQHRPAALPAARPALTITVLARTAEASAAPLPAPPFRSDGRAASAAAAPPTGAPELVPAIGRRFARREVAGGFPEIASRGPAGGGEIATAQATGALVRWRPVAGHSSDNAPTRTGARPRRRERDADLQVAPTLPTPWAEPPLPAHPTGPIPDRGIPSPDRTERSGPSAAIALPGLSLRLVPPEEATRRLAQGEDATGRGDLGPGARSEAGARGESPPSSAQPSVDIGAIVDRVQRELKRREQFERERKGLL